MNRVIWLAAAILLCAGAWQMMYTAHAYAALNFKSAKGQFTDTASPTGLNTSAKPEDVVAAVISTALSLIGVLFLILMIYGGIIWMLARGDEGEATRAKDIIKMALIGMIIVLLAYGATLLIVNELIPAISTQ